MTFTRLGDDVVVEGKFFSSLFWGEMLANYRKNLPNFGYISRGRSNIFPSVSFSFLLFTAILLEHIRMNKTYQKGIEAGLQKTPKMLIAESSPGSKNFFPVKISCLLRNSFRISLFRYS